MLRKILITFLLIPSFILACDPVFVSNSPFLISDVKKNKEDKIFINSTERTVRDVISTEKVSESSNNFDFSGRILKKGSVVRMLDSEVRLNNSEETLIKVQTVTNISNERLKILNTPDTQDPNLSLTQREALQYGDEGYIVNKALKKMGSSDLLVLQSSARLFNFGNLNYETIHKNYALRPVIRNGKYKTMKCSDGKQHYVFEILDMETGQATGKYVGVDKNTCSPFQHLEMSNFNKFSQFIKKVGHYLGGAFIQDDLEFNEFGMVNLPLNEVDRNNRNIASKSPDGSYVHYKGGDPYGSDTWGNPDSICQFVKFANTWKEKCINDGYDPDQCTTQVGDIAFIGGPGRRADNNKDLLGHRYHHDGTCFDIRPFRVDSNHMGTTITYDKEGYSRELTKKFIDHAMTYGARPIYFDDPEMMQEYGSTKECDLDTPGADDEERKPLRCDGHANHIHFCFKPKNIRGCRM